MIRAYNSKTVRPDEIGKFVVIITIIKTTRLSMTEVGMAGWAWSTHT